MTQPTTNTTAAISWPELRMELAKASSFYMDPDTTRFFNAKYHDQPRRLANGRVAWVDSIQFVGSDGYRAPREYRVSVMTVGAHNVEQVAAYASNETYGTARVEITDRPLAKARGYLRGMQ